MRPRAFAHVLVGLLVAAAAPADSVKSEFVGGADVSSWRTFAWLEGTPAFDGSVEDLIHGSIRKRLEVKGLREVEGEADCYAVTAVMSAPAFQLGILRIGVLDAETRQAVFRVEITTVVEDPDEVRKRLPKLIKKAFKKFPKVRR